MKKLILILTIVFASASIMNANSKPNLDHCINEILPMEVATTACVENAGAYIQSLNWNTEEELDRAIEWYTLLILLCDLQE